MPMVGGKEFPYTEKGKAAAKRAENSKSLLNTGTQRKTGKMFITKNQAALDKMKMDNAAGQQDSYLRDDKPGAMSKDMRKKALKKRLKSKGMK
jgi:hypothetical protein